MQYKINYKHKENNPAGKVSISSKPPDGFVKYELNMKKIIVPILTLAAVSLACQQEKTLEDLEAEKRTLKSEFKQDSLTYIASLNTLDSLIQVHPENGNQVKNIKSIPVTVDTARVVNFEHFFEVHGSVEAEENAALYAEAPGIVKKIHVIEGQKVKKGDAIISLDASSMESGLKELQTGYELAEKVFLKQEKLWEQKIGSELQYLEAKTNKESLAQKLKTMKEQMDMYVIRAPFDGMVDIISPKVGEAAAPGFPVARIMNLEKVYLEADVSEKYFNTVREGSLVEIKFPSLGESILAKVARSGEYINSSNRTFKVKVVFDNPKGKYKPNQLAILKIRDYVANDATVIPSRVIQEDRNGQSYVYTYQDKNGVLTVKKLPIQLGVSYEGMTEILGGIDGGAAFVDKGSKSIQDGDAITIK